MNRGMYSAATALVAASEQQETIAYNMANATSPGYRERGIVFETFDRVLGRATEPTGDVVGTRVVEAYHDFRPGPVQQTGNPFDLALGEADRFFVLAGPNGPVYTRNGSFTRTVDGRLVNPSGYPLQGLGGNITFPGDANQVRIAADGSLTADGQPLGVVRVVRFTNPQQLVAAGPTLYTAPPGAGLTVAPGRVISGAREGSNVQPADAMVRLIIGSRYFDAAQRALRAMSDALQLNTKPTG